MNISNFYRHIIAITFLLYLPLLCLSQQYNFHNYSVEEGLAQSQVYAICEDLNGNIWSGTRGGGLSCFDGISFTNYTVQEGLPGNYIKAIIKDKSGNLWIGTGNGVSRYNGKKFTNYTFAQGLYNEMVNALILDRKGTLWIGTEKGIFHLEKDTLVRFGRKLGAPMERITSLKEDNSGNIWAGSEHGLYRFERNSKTWAMRHYTTNDGLSSNLITALTTQKNGKLWICTYSGGISIFENDHFETIAKADGLTNNTVFSCAEGDESTMWLGTASGITKYQHQKSDSASYTLTQIIQTEGFANNVVMSVIRDSFGNLWFGTSGGGISKLDSERFLHYTAIKGTFGSWVYSIAQEKDGNMWFGTSEGGVTRYDGKYYQRFSEKDGFTASKIKFIHQDSPGNLWFGTISDGLYLYNGKTFRHFDNKNGLSSNFINYILSDSSGRIWLATAGGGINYLIPSENNTFQIRHINLKNGLNSDRINTLLLDAEHNIWAGGINGSISKINLQEGNDKFTIVNYKTKSIGSGNNVRCAVQDKNGLIYFGTANAGIILFDGKSFSSWTKEQGLASNNIYSLIFDNDQNLWIGTEKGIDKLSLSDALKIKTIRHYGKPEGFLGIETIQNSVCKDKDGNIWFGSLKSATVFNPSKEKPLKLPSIHLTGIHLFFDKIENTPFGKNLASWYPIPKNLILPYDKNHLSFEFIGVEQSNPEAVRYKWKLEGFDDDWSPATSKREAVYSNLSPGKYTFKVLAGNEENRWHSTPVSYNFIINPPFWKTWWFGLTVLLIFTLLAWWMISSAFRKIRQDNAAEHNKLEVEKTLIELEQKALRLQMNPHFLFNCLNSIKGLIAENKQEEAKIYLSRFAKLMRSMLDNSMEAFITLESEISGLNIYAELEKLSREDKFDFSIDTYPDIDPASIQIPPMLIQPFVENSIIHGIAPKTGKGFVKVSFSLDGNYLKCTIEDDGIGREKAGQMKEESMQKHKSTAIAVTQERLNIINKKLNFGEVKILIGDLKNDQNMGSGTKVEIYIPYQQI